MNRSLEGSLVTMLGLSLAAMLVIIGLLVRSEMFPANPSDFDSKRIVIDTPVVKAGGELLYSIPVKKYGIYPADISGTLISKDRKIAYALSKESGALPPGNYDELHQEVEIPKRVNPGEYTYSRIYSYSVGRAKVIKHYETPLFEVVK